MTNNQDLLSVYLGEINRYPLLTREEEQALIRRALSGDRAARERLIRSNLRFVVALAKRYRTKDMPLLDLINEGNIGLLKAIEHFDAQRGYHFISYAAWWVRQSILKALSENSRMIRLPWNRVNELLRIERWRREMLDRNAGAEDLGRIAEDLGMAEGHVRDLINLSRKPLSLDSPVSGDGELSLLGDLICDTTMESPEEAAVKHCLREHLRRLLETLSPKEADILALRYGLKGEKSLSLREVGKRYRLSRERVRQIEKKAIMKLRCRRGLLEAYVV
ncbi:MAG: sigma-70 family RNA polymerase sigma factor [Spirochaetales bacterium]|nr:sigma-70 family RNA polymerase sigma factor [Spirochaetales bacterium]